MPQGKRLHAAGMSLQYALRVRIIPIDNPDPALAHQAALAEQIFRKRSMLALPDMIRLDV